MTAMHRTLLKWFACCALGLADAARARFKVDMLPPPIPTTALTFRVLCMHDVRDNLRASFADMPGSVRHRDAHADRSVRVDTREGIQPHQHATDHRFARAGVPRCRRAPSC